MAMGLKETAAANSEGSMPKWQKDLGLKAGHSAIPKLAAISDFFAGLSLPLQALPRAEADETVRRFRQRDDSQPHKPDFEYDKDYFFGRNEGEPDSVRLNAQAAWYEERQGVELWRILKSVAFVTPNKNLVLVHLRGDRDVNKTALAEMLGFQETDLGQANLEELGVEYGTVSPFIRNANVPIRHVFDRDLVDGKDYPRDDIVFASPGDKRFYVGFDVRKYLKAETQTSGVIERANISLQSQDSPRIVARRRIAIIGGDSSIDTSNLKSLVATTITDSLKEKELYYGDRSLPDIDDISTRRLSGSINAALHGPQLRSVALEIASEIQEKTPQEQFLPRGQDSRIITTFSSMAMHTTAGKELRKMEGIEYVGPQEAVNNELLELKKRGVDVTHTILVGLSAAYDRNDSAFGEDILDTTLPVDDGMKERIKGLVQECKTGNVNMQKFSQILDGMLNKTNLGKNGLIGKNIAVILGASELENFARSKHEPLKPYFAIRASNPDAIAEAISKAPDSTIRLILIQPSRALAELIAQKTLGLEA